ncbi:MAG: hypothetical protein K2H72_09145, partial [Muribaculaceae bacterium]|nr:hypothetical protein [Muribaculaceae bacterium]
TGTEYDAARCQWGEGWRMPTSEEWEELQSYCHMELSKETSGEVCDGISKVDCLRIWGPNGNSILLPVTFSPHGGTYPDVLRGEYWTSTACTGLTDYMYPSAIQISYNPANPKLESYSNARHDGLAIRPVLSRENTGSGVSEILQPSPALKYENGSISVCGSADGCKLTVSDISGRTICSYPISDNICNLPTLSKGTYIATLRKESKTISSIMFLIKAPF